MQLDHVWSVLMKGLHCEECGSGNQLGAYPIPEREREFVVLCRGCRLMGGDDGKLFQSSTKTSEEEKQEEYQ